MFVWVTPEVAPLLADLRREHTARYGDGDAADDVQAAAVDLPGGRFPRAARGRTHGGGRRHPSPAQPEVLALYPRLGHVELGNYGKYADTTGFERTLKPR